MKDPKLPTNAWNPDFAEPEDTPEDGAHTMSFQQDDWLRMKAQYEQRIEKLEAERNELRVCLISYAEFFSTPDEWHLLHCPQDDTCVCEWPQRIEKALEDG